MTGCHPRGDESPQISRINLGQLGVNVYSCGSLGLHGLAEPAVEIRCIQVEVRVTRAGERLTSEREMHAWEPMAVTRASALRVEIPLTEASMITA